MRLVIRTGPIPWDWCPSKKRRWGRDSTEERPREDTGRRRPSVSQAQGPEEKPAPSTPSFWTSRPQGCETVNASCPSHPGCGTLFQRPGLSHTTLEPGASLMKGWRRPPQCLQSATQVPLCLSQDRLSGAQVEVEVYFPGLCGADSHGPSTLDRRHFLGGASSTCPERSTCSLSRLVVSCTKLC